MRRVPDRTSNAFDITDLLFPVFTRFTMAGPYQDKQLAYALLSFSRQSESSAGHRASKTEPLGRGTRGVRDWAMWESGYIDVSDRSCHFHLAMLC